MRRLHREKGEGRRQERLESTFFKSRLSPRRLFSFAAAAWIAPMRRHGWAVWIRRLGAPQAKDQCRRGTLPAFRAATVMGRRAFQRRWVRLADALGMRSAQSPKNSMDGVLACGVSVMLARGARERVCRLEDPVAGSSGMRPGDCCTRHRRSRNDGSAEALRGEEEGGSCRYCAPRRRMMVLMVSNMMSRSRPSV